MAIEAPPSNAILRRIWEERRLAESHLLAGPPTDKTADQIGAAYLHINGRYRALVELEEFVREKLASGDDIED